MMTMKKEIEMREEKRERRIGHLPCSNEGVQDERCSEKALRRLSRSIEEVRLHSRHGQICACVYVLLIRSHSFFLALSLSLSLSTFFFLVVVFSLLLFFFFHIQQRRQKRPLVYVLRIITSSASLPLVTFFSLSHIPMISIGRSTTALSLVESITIRFERERERKEGRKQNVRRCLSEIVNQQ